MNWLLMFKDEVYIYGCCQLIDFICYKNYVYVKIGLINKDFDEICSLESKMEVCGSILEKVEIFQEDIIGIFFDEFYFSICLCWNVIFLIKFNGIR